MKVISMFRKGGVVPVTIAATISLFLVVSIVQATTTISTDITTGGALSVGTTATLTGAVAASSTLQVTGAQTNYGTLTVSGTGATALGGALSVTGATSLANASTTQVSASGIAWLNGNVNFGGFATTTAATGAFATQGAIAASSTLQVTNNQTNYGTLTIVGTGATTLGGALNVTGLSTFGASGFVSQASSTVVGAFKVTGAVAASSTVLVTGNQTNYGDLTVIGTFSPAITSVTSLISQASSTVVGAFTVTGNTSLQQASSTNQTLSGIAWLDGNVNFGGFATTTATTGAFATQGAIAASSTLQVTNNQTNYGTLTIVGTGATTLGGALNVTGLSTFGANGFVSQASSTVVGAFTVTGTTALANASTTQHTASDISWLNGNVNFGGFATTTALTGAFATQGAVAASSTLQVTGATVLYSALNKGIVAMVAGTKDVTVAAGSVCTVTENGTATSTKAIVSGTTLTITVGNPVSDNNTDNVSYICL